MIIIKIMSLKAAMSCGLKGLSGPPPCLQTSARGDGNITNI